MERQPICVVVTGRPGAGKSTLAGKLNRLFHMPLLSRDEIKEGYVNSFGVSHDQLPEDTNQHVNDLFFAAANLFLEGNISILVEAAFQHHVWQNFIPAWSNLSRVYILVCEVDPAISARRHLERGLSDETRTYYHGDYRVQHYRKTGEFLEAGVYTPPSFDVPTLSIQTSDGYLPELTEITEFIFS